MSWQSSCKDSIKHGLMYLARASPVPSIGKIKSFCGDLKYNPTKVPQWSNFLPFIYFTSIKASKKYLFVAAKA